MIYRRYCRMNKRFKLVVLVLVIVLLISSMSVLLTSCNTPKYYASLEQAYAEGKISRQDLMSIVYYKHNGNYDFGEDFVPTPINPKELDEETQEKIINMFLNEEGLIGDTGVNHWTWRDRVGKFAYLGTYNGIIVCMIPVTWFLDGGFFETIYIDEFEFTTRRTVYEYNYIAIELW